MRIVFLITTELDGGRAESFSCISALWQYFVAGLALGIRGDAHMTQIAGIARVQILLVDPTFQIGVFVLLQIATILFGSGGRRWQGGLLE
jgi:hypothetical protein